MGGIEEAVPEDATNDILTLAYAGGEVITKIENAVSPGVEDQGQTSAIHVLTLSVIRLVGA